MHIAALFGQMLLFLLLFSKLGVKYDVSTTYIFRLYGPYSIFEIASETTVSSP